VSKRAAPDPALPESRLAAAPDVPTVDEAGLPGFYTASWTALWVPKGTPKDVIAKLNTAAVDGLADANVRARLTDLAQEIFPRERQTPRHLARYRKPKSRSGGRSSRRRTSKANNQPRHQGERHETSASSISASGSECCRSLGHIADRKGVNLPDEAGAVDRRLSPLAARPIWSPCPDALAQSLPAPHPSATQTAADAPTAMMPPYRRRPRKNPGA
jgi:hypothetical protein